MPKKSTSPAINVTPSTPILRTVVTHENFKKWQACIYYSPYDQTSQILLLLKTKTGDSTDRFLKYPIYFFAAPSKIEIDSKITRSISSLFNLKNPSEIIPVPDEQELIYKQSA